MTHCPPALHVHRGPVHDVRPTRALLLHLRTEHVGLDGIKRETHLLPRSSREEAEQAHRWLHVQRERGEA